jgi:hypothetical protein
MENTQHAGQRPAVSDPIEAQIRSVWCEILGTAHIANRDSFFALGGESISATLCANRLQRIFQVRIPLSVLLDAQTTVERLADRIRASTTS